MRVNDYRTINTMPLSELEPGDVFNYDNCFYFVTTETHSSYITVVNLETGEVRCLDETIRVEYIENASVSINN